MTGEFESFLALPEQDRQDVCEAAAVRLDTLPGHGSRIVCALDPRLLQLSR